MAIFSLETLNNFSILGEIWVFYVLDLKTNIFEFFAGIVIDAIVQLVVLSFLLGISVFFLFGIKEKSPKKCLPFLILSGFVAVVSLLNGLIFLNAAWIIVSAIKIYYFIVVFSLYQVFKYGDEQAAYEAHQSANSAGYEQFYEPEGYNNIQSSENGYQTTELREP